MTNAVRLPFTISNQSLTFYVKGKPHSLVRDHASYAKARELLQAPGDHDVEHLLALVDVRQALMRESHGKIVFDGDDIIFRGQPLHNVWVDRILDFRNAGEDFSPIWNALDKLVHNPTKAAIERLPIFLERTQLGFLPDGRFIAFKGVQSDYCSAHASPDGTRFTHQIGDKPRMAREDVDADPNQTCSRGLHVGAPGYVRQHYSGGSYALVLVAVDPVDVVAVPTDYNGEKMRVCGYEVIDHLDQDYSDELLGKLRNTVTGYTPAPVEDDEDEHGGVDDTEENENEIPLLPEEDDSVTHPPGTVVEYVEFDATLYGVVGDGDLVRGLDGHLIEPDRIVRVLGASEITAAVVACEGAEIRVEGDPAIKDGDYTIIGYSEDEEHTQLNGNHWFWKVDLRDVDGGVSVMNHSIKTVVVRGEQVWPRTVAEQVEFPVEPQPAPPAADVLAAAQAQVDRTPLRGDLVEASGEGWPPAGVYPVLASNSEGCTVQTEHDGVQVVLASRIGTITRRPWMRAEINGYVKLAEDSSSACGAGLWQVADLAVNSATPQIQVLTNGGNHWIDARRVIGTVRPDQA